MVKVYIASPYTKGDVAVNVKRQIDCAEELMNLGFLTFVPLYFHFQHMAHPRPYDYWTKVDLEWIRVCNVVLRLEGESEGADKEVEFAKSIGVEVVYNIEELINKYEYR